MVFYDFSGKGDLPEWTIVNDVVMGGRSQSALTIDADGNGLFKGTVSLENNGGFCSVRCRCGRVEVTGFETLALRVKGDGKRYQARIRAKSSDDHAYIAYFETTGEWQTIEIPLEKMFPSFRGRRLNLPNFHNDTFEEFAFLTNNKKAENFELRIDKLMVK